MRGIAKPLFGMATALALALPAAASAQSRGSGAPPAPTAPVTETPATAAAVRAAAQEGRTLRSRVGADVAARLMRSSDRDERLRGVDRAAHTHSPEALVLLERAAAPGAPGGMDPRASLDGLSRADPRALLAVVQALASWTETDRARATLASIVGAPAESFALRADGSDDGQGTARVQLARQEAAIALARSGKELALETLIAISRSGGPGQAAALIALTLYPPEAPLLGGVTLTIPAMVSLAASVGDLRSFEAIEGATRTSDPALRASALVALGEEGAARTADLARGAAGDPDGRVRVAAGEALVRLGAPGAADVVSGLIGDDSTAPGGLRLALLSQGESVVKAAAAVAVASANAERRAAAVAALGRQLSALAVDALVTLVADPLLQGDAACALGRSPSHAAMAALEAMIGERPRLAARAYLMRRLVRGERSVRLDQLLMKLAKGASAIDRAVGVEALVATGELAVAVALADGDARVRRAAAMGALGRWDAKARNALLDRMAIESDPATRQVLALGLVDGDANAIVSSNELGDRARAGGPDAPLASLSLARRASGDEHDVPAIDALLRSRDPLLRAHVARGLGLGAAPVGIGRLVQAYRWEAEVQVRRAIIAALAAREAANDATMARSETLALARDLDPDTTIRRIAARGLSGLPAPTAGPSTEVAWIRLVPAAGAARPATMTAALVASDGLALPIAFDDEGFALVPGVAPGWATLRLAPRLPSYEPSPP